MKRLFVLPALCFSLILHAQQGSLRNYVFPEPPPTNSYLLYSGSNTIMIWQEDVMNLSHLWTTFDSTMNMVKKTKLITPNALDIINQSYYETPAGIIRADQFINNQSLHASIYLFDAYGNITFSRQLTDSNEYKAFTDKKKIRPFSIVLSADKNYISLVQTQTNDTGQLSIAAIIISADLKKIDKKSFVIPFDPELQALFPPVLSNNGTILVYTTDAFSNYKLGSVADCYILEPGQTTASRKEFRIPRKKLKDPSFKIEGAALYFSSFFSDGETKDLISGFLQGTFDLAANKWLHLKDHSYSDDTKKALKKIYGQPGSANLVLNNMNLLPDGNRPGQNIKYAVLLPDKVKRKNREDPYYGSSARVPYINTTDVQYRLDRINGLIGAQPLGFSRPIGNFAEAFTFAAVNPNVIPPDYRSLSNNINSISQMGEKSPPPGQWHMPINLLYFEADSSTEIKKFQISKIRTTSDRGYTFTAYNRDSAGYYCLYYHSKGLRKPFLNKIRINEKGEIEEKKVFEQHDKIFDNRYPFIIRNNQLIAFYYYKETGDIGIIKTAL